MAVKIARAVFATRDLAAAAGKGKDGKVVRRLLAIASVRDAASRGTAGRTAREDHRPAGDAAASLHQAAWVVTHPTLCGNAGFQADRHQAFENNRFNAPYWLSPTPVRISSIAQIRLGGRASFRISPPSRTDHSGT